MTKCKELHKRCHDCGYFFRRDERYLNCPDCGKSRECGSYVNKGSIYCEEHGGANVKRVTRSPDRGGRVVTGAQSKHLITKIASKYLESKENALYVLNKRSVDALDSRIVELMERTGAESSPERMERIVNLWNKLNNAVPGLKFDVANDKEACKAFNALDTEMEAAFHDYAAWRQIMEAMDLRRKIGESDMKIMKDMKALMTAEQGMELVAQLFAAVMKVLRDEPNGQNLIHLIRLEFDAITGADTLRETQAGRGETIDI